MGVPGPCWHEEVPRESKVTERGRPSGQRERLLDDPVAYLVKPLLAPASHTGAGLSSGHPTFHPAHLHAEESSTGEPKSLDPCAMWVTPKKLVAPGFCLAQSSEGVSQHMEMFPSLSVTAFHINQSLMVFLKIPLKRN